MFIFFYEINSLIFLNAYKFVHNFVTLEEKYLRIFSEFLSEFVRILAAFSESWQNNSKKFRKKKQMN